MLMVENIKLCVSPHRFTSGTNVGEKAKISHLIEKMVVKWWKE